MEKSKDTNKESSRTQRFYFDEAGKLVVETNKGVYVDGEQYVKMYGIFTCNAKTMGEIIHAMKGIPVEIGEKIFLKKESTVVNQYVGEERIIEETKDYYCILDVDEEKIEEYKREAAQRLAEQERNDWLTAEKNRWMYKYSKLTEKVDKINRLPWWKRMFKKVEIE